ncbi:MAG: hypothetical protein V2A63_00535 [Patescibacteria group bacterium]
MKFLQELHANKKLQFALVIAVAVALIFGGSQVRGHELGSDVTLSTGALVAVQAEADKVKAARDEYFAAIGKGDGGIYDQYIEAANCPVNLNTRLTALKNLRNDLQRLSGEIVMRERENGSELPRGTIERELNVIESTIRPNLLLNQLETFQSELDKIETAAAGDPSSSAQAVTASVATVRDNLEKIGTADSLVEPLKTIESKLPYLSEVTKEITSTSLSNLNSIIANSNASAAIRPTLATIRQLANNNDQSDLIEPELQKIENTLPNFAADQQTTIQSSIDTIRKLLSRKTAVEVRQAEISSVKNEMQQIADAVFSQTEITQFENQEVGLRNEFQTTTAALQNCTANNDELERCAVELQDWVLAKENYEQFITNLENTASARTIQAQNKLKPLQEKLNDLQSEENDQNFSPELGSASLLGIEARYLKADEVDLSGMDMSAFDNWDEGVRTAGGGSVDASSVSSGDSSWSFSGAMSSLASGAASVGSAVGSVLGGVVSAPLAAVSGLIGGASNVLSSGISAVARATGIAGIGSLTSSAVVFDGPGALTGLQTFKQSYKGNSYGSAIGVITGWTNFALPFVGVIAIAVLVYAGFLYLTAAGSEDQTKKAKNILIWVAIGIIIIFSAYAIVNTLLSTNSSSGGSGTSVGVNIGGIGFNYSN